MFAIVYEWDIPAEREQEFVRAWTAATRSIREHCKSFGSRLHHAQDGRWVAYARWPSFEARDGCTPELVPDLENLTDDLVGSGREVYRLRIVEDLLAEPSPT